MLATFTANLAAFLTVERMQSPVQSLDQLSRQSRINYTVVKDSDTHQYFKNMKNAEDTLYDLWKNLTLSSTSDDTQYRWTVCEKHFKSGGIFRFLLRRIWDYPVKSNTPRYSCRLREQILWQMLLKDFELSTNVKWTILLSFMMQTKSNLRYLSELTHFFSFLFLYKVDVIWKFRSCTYTAVGDIFAEQPYAVAVQQGSHLQVI